MIRAASVVELTPTSGEPGDSVGVEGTDFAVSASIGIGFGPEVAIADESNTIADTGKGSAPRTISGFTDYYPIKPGSFNWTFNQGGTLLDYYDNGDGTLWSYVGTPVTTVINYTSGFFSRTGSGVVEWDLLGSTVDYTTYEFDVTPAGLRTNSSGGLSGELTVPAIWNGTESVTVVDEAGNVATSDFTVEGSDVIPEPLTMGAIVLLSSAALVVSFYCLRKRPYNKHVA